MGPAPGFEDPAFLEIALAVGEGVVVERLAQLAWGCDPFKHRVNLASEENQRAVYCTIEGHAQRGTMGTITIR